jgi:serine/threonine protein kinase
MTPPATHQFQPGSFSKKTSSKSSVADKATFPADQIDAPKATKPIILGIWRLCQVLHRGAWCDLHAAQPADALGSPRLDYVVKTIRPNIDDPGEAASQLRQEVTISALARHPHLVPVLDADLASNRPFVVMPRIEGITLQESLHRSPQPIPVALWWIRQVAQAVSALHSIGWNHGDLKPDNLLVDGRGHLTVMDLGFAQPVGNSTLPGFRGTVDYASPELLAGEPLTSASDIYAIGKILSQLLQHSDQSCAMADELVSQLTSEASADRLSAPELIEQLLKLEIETLHLHIQPRKVA